MRALLSKPPPSDDPPQTPPYAGVRKRSHVPIACQVCRKRKIKCDSRRPRCTPCVLSNQECRFASPDGDSQRDDLLRQLQATNQKHNHLLTVIEALRRAEGEQLDEIVRRIRSAGSVDDFLDMVGDASLLLQPVSTHPRRRNTFSNEASQSSSGYTSAPGSSATDQSTQPGYEETPPRPKEDESD